MLLNWMDPEIAQRPGVRSGRVPRSARGNMAMTAPRVMYAKRMARSECCGARDLNGTWRERDQMRIGDYMRVVGRLGW